MLARLLGGLRGGPLAAASLLLFFAAPAVASAQAVRIGTTPPLPAGATLVAADASVRSLQVTVALEPRNPAALAAYANDVSSPGGAEYRHFLTTAQFRARFAPARATVQTVERALRARGLEPGKVDAGGLALTVDASGGAIEHAFDLTLAEVRLKGGRDAIYNVQAPAVSARIAPDVQAVIGLSTLYPMRSTVLHAPSDASPLASAHTILAAHVATGGPQPCARAVDDAPGSGGYTADQIASYYDFAPLYRAGDEGQGVTVAVYELEPDSPADIAAYQKCYGTDAQVTYVKVDKGAGTGSGSGEAALDIDQVIGLAPKVHLLVYQGPNTNNGSGPYATYAAIADQDKASVVSTSWGNCEPQETLSEARAEQTLFEQMAVQGQTLVAASGDSGSEDCWIGGAGGNSDNNLRVDDPASQPFVTGAGGTSLELGVFNIGGQGNLTYPTANPDETVWNNSYPGLQYATTWGISPGAGGGGVSSFWPMPSYQSQTTVTAPWLNVVNAESSGAACGAPAGSYCREVPDVSADADPMDGYMTYWNGQGSAKDSGLSGWQSVGGTSAVAPLWAAVFALAEASRECAHNLIGFANPSLYALASASPSAYARYFADITNDAINAAGDTNDLTASGNEAGLYQAGVGYDMATGLGSPNAANLASGLCGGAIAVHTPALKPQEFVDAHVKVRVAGTPPAGGTGTVTYTAKNLPAGLRLNAATGVISGTVTRAGDYDTVLGASASVSANGSTPRAEYGARRYVWRVARHATASKLQLVGASSGHPSLAFRVQSGTDESELRSVTVKLPAGVSLAPSLHDISVTGTAGQPVGYRLSRLHGELVITFSKTHFWSRIVFKPGSLLSRGSLLAGSAAPLKLVLGVLDASDAHSTVTSAIIPKTF